MSTYNSKILLFGEYSILLGSDALAFPFKRFNGNFSFENKNGGYNINESQKVLHALKEHIANVNDRLYFKINLEKFTKDVEKGMYFNSTIPKNYGLGSSGALCAAVYGQYRAHDTEIKIKELIDVRNDLALIESHFHGKSSGIDPLCSFVNKPLRLSQTLIQYSKLPSKKKLHIFLIDSLQNGYTGSMVHNFKQKWEDQDFIYKMINQYIPLNNKCIDSFLSNQNTIIDEIFELSYFQMEHFNEMIPKSITSIWKEGLQYRNFSLKLCGSGGGGFILGFTPVYSDTMEYFNKKGIPFISVNP